MANKDTGEGHATLGAAVKSVGTAAGSVTNAMLAPMPARTLKGNDTGAPAAPQDLTAPEVQTLLTIAVATPAALAALAVAGIPSGQQALVAATRVGAGSGIYILQTAVSSTPDSFFVIATADDAARQWVMSVIQEGQLVSFVTPAIDYTAPQVVTIYPPIGYRIASSLALAQGITTKDGTVTTGPTVKFGTNATRDNMAPATAQVTLAAAAVNTTTGVTGLVAASFGFDLTSDGMKYEITVGAVLGTATQFKGPLRGNYQLWRLV